MNLVKLNCKVCGESNLKIDGDSCSCNCCGASYLLERAEKYADEVRTIFGEALAEQKEEQIANCRRNLWKAARAEHVSSTEVLNYARELKKLLPDDFQANFYEVANSGTLRQINSFINKINVEENGIYVADIADFIIRSLESSNVLPLKDLITRGLKGDKYTQYMTKVEDEAAKLKDGIYSPQVPRDVFVAYSSKDGKAVNEIVEFLEENKISCFVALRNLRHGRGSVENYLNNLKTAMHNCKCVVFLSSDHSRDLDCDALKIELPYIKDNEPQMGRIEYLLSEYGADTPTVAKIILEDFFNGLEYCRTQEDLVRRILKYIIGQKTQHVSAVSAVEEVKYCLNCGEKNPAKAKRCMECGSDEFAENYEDFLRAKLAKELRKELEEEYKNKFAPQPQFPSSRPARGAAPTFSTKSEFEIEGTVLKKYNGTKAEVVIPEGVAAIGYEAFYNCDITSITIPNSVTIIGDGAFYSCGRLTSITIPASVKTIGNGAFMDCSGLTSITIPSSVTSIGDVVFSGCSGLTSITIPSSVTSIGDFAFYGCDGLKTIYCERGSQPAGWDKHWLNGCRANVVWGHGASAKSQTETVSSTPLIYDKSEFEIDGTVLTKYNGNKVEVIIPDGVTIIGDYAFRNCSGLISITIPSSVTTIGESAFFSCRGLTNITIPSSVTTIGEWAFCDCSGLTSITIPNSVIEIGYNAFRGCSGLKSIIIPNSVTTIGGGAFCDCSGLTSITIPNSVTEIGYIAFWGCSGLKSITIPNSVTQIGKEAFWGCSGLTSITIPNSVTTIGEYAFAPCNNLKTIYCEAASKPAKWSNFWRAHCKAKVVWGYKGK